MDPLQTTGGARSAPRRVCLVAVASPRARNLSPHKGSSALCCPVPAPAFGSTVPLLYGRGAQPEVPRPGTRDYVCPAVHQSVGSSSGARAPLVGAASSTSEGLTSEGSSTPAGAPHCTGQEVHGDASHSSYRPAQSLPPASAGEPLRGRLHLRPFTLASSPPPPLSAPLHRPLNCRSFPDWAPQHLTRQHCDTQQEGVAKLRLCTGRGQGQEQD